MMYAVVAFLDSDCVDWVPVKWITSVNGAALEDIGTLIAIGASVKVYWPPTSNPSGVSRARNRCSDRETHWSSFDCRILGAASEY